MIGKKYLRYLVADLNAPGVPDCGARSFSDMLYQRTRCRLAWQSRRRVFVVYRAHGTHQNPTTYMDIGPDRWPISPTLLTDVVEHIRLADAAAGGDYVRLQRAIESRVNDEQSRAREKLAEDFAPELASVIRRLREIRGDGRVRTRFFDMAGNVSR